MLFNFLSGISLLTKSFITKKPISLFDKLVILKIISFKALIFLGKYRLPSGDKPLNIDSLNESLIFELIKLVNILK